MFEEKYALVIRLPNTERTGSKYQIWTLKEDKIVFEIDSKEELKIKLDLMNLKIDKQYTVGEDNFNLEKDNLWMDYKKRKRYFYGKSFLLKGK